ncbi:protein of unknown function [Alcaligenes faecalis subsp. faecalis]|nr:protein of unknown function [Alcaligenes faecalis subsp. faecalis]
MAHSSFFPVGLCFVSKEVGAAYFALDNYAANVRGSNAKSDGVWYFSVPATAGLAYSHIAAMAILGVRAFEPLHGQIAQALVCVSHGLLSSWRAATIAAISSGVGRRTSPHVWHSMRVASTG